MESEVLLYLYLNKGIDILECPDSSNNNIKALLYETSYGDGKKNGLSYSDCSPAFDISPLPHLLA